MQEEKIDEIVEKLYREKHYILVLCERLEEQQSKLKSSLKEEEWLQFAHKLRHFSGLAESEFELLRSQIEAKLQREKAVVGVLKERLSQELRDILLEFLVGFTEVAEKEDTANGEKKMLKLLEEMSEDEEEAESEEDSQGQFRDELERFNTMRRERGKWLKDKGATKMDGQSNMCRIEDISEISGKEVPNGAKFSTQNNLEEPLSKK